LFNISKEAMEYVAPTVLILLAALFSFLFVIFMKRLSKKQEQQAKLFEQEILSSSFSERKPITKK
jgi:hypothetical protein